MSFSTTIYSDAIAFEGFKELSRKKYLKVWCEFQREGRQFWRVQEWMPTEDEFSKYFRYLRLEKKLSSFTLRKTYSIINAVVKGKYGERLQKHPRLEIVRYWYQEKSCCVRDGRSWGVRGQPRTFYSTLACQKGYNDPGILWWPEAFWKQVFVIEHFNLNC